MSENIKKYQKNKKNQNVTEDASLYATQYLFLQNNAVFGKYS